jgi:hypothetical protein
MHKILALAQNIGVLSKYRQQMYAANVGVKCWRQMLVSNVCGFPKYMRQMLASNLCGIVKLLGHIINDRNKADVEISAPIKIYARNVCVHQKIGAQTLTIWARQNLQLLTSSKFGSHSGDVASRACSPQVRDGLPARCFYLRTLSRTVPPVVLARLVKISALCPNICGRLYSGNFR